MKLITGNSHPVLADQLSQCLGVSLVQCTVTKFSNTEIKIEIHEVIRGQHIYILQTGTFDNDENYSVNDYLMETLILVDACRRSNAKSITLIMPLYPYSRQDKKDAPRVPISSKLVANLFSSAGINRIISVDLHASQIQGFLDIPFDNLYAINLISEYLSSKIFVNMTLDEIQKKYIFVSPDNGGTKRIVAYSKKFKIDNVIMHKQRDYSASSKIDEVILVGKQDLTDKTAIIIDDMVDTMGTMVNASKVLVENGAKSVIIIATHGVLSGSALDRINNSEHIEKVIVTNTVPQQKNCEKCPKLNIVDISPLLCEVVKCIRDNKNISHMFS
jgi:ribose-phosphate pyrophosphokinase